MKLSDLILSLLVLSTRRTGSVAPPIVSEKNLGAEYPLYEDDSGNNVGGWPQRKGDNPDPNPANLRKQAKGFNEILNLILAEMLKGKANLAQDLSKPIRGNRMTSESEVERQEKKAGENFIRFGRKRRRSDQKAYHLAATPLIGQKLIRWDKNDDCEPGIEGDNRDPWVIVSHQEQLREGPASETFVRFGKGSRLDDGTNYSGTGRPPDDGTVADKRRRDTNTNVYKCRL